MKTIRKLKTLDLSGYFVKEMVKILDVQPEYFMINDFESCKDSLTIFNVCYCEENSVPHVVFSNIECIFRKSGVFCYLIFCESDKTKKILDSYVSIVDQLKEEIWSFVGMKYLLWVKIS